MPAMAASVLAGQTALITGAARGIGAACAVELARAGVSRVVLCDVRAAEDDVTRHTIGLCEEAGSVVTYRQADVGDRAAMEAVFQEAGSVGILINNAAINIRKPLLELSVDDVAAVWQVILWGTFHCSQLAARQMVESGRGGSIVMISSVHAERAFPRSTSYNGAKAAVNQMALTWAAELAPQRIRVNVIEPGWTDTPGERTFYTEKQILEEGARLPLGRLATPEEIARAARFLVSPDASYITGAVLRVDGGIVLPQAH
ncbi:MAG: SDR family oxidoreductase [Bryobacterales bacterium]|nr:SDR family oxidoreductase [Bryobacterales bacterium]